MTSERKQRPTIRRFSSRVGAGKGGAVRWSQGRGEQSDRSELSQIEARAWHFITFLLDLSRSCHCCPRSNSSASRHHLHVGSGTERYLNPQARRRQYATDHFAPLCVLPYISVVKEGVSAAPHVCCLTDAANCSAVPSLPASSETFKPPSFGTGRREGGKGAQDRSTMHQ